MRVRSLLCGEDPLKEGMATHYRILAWRTPWTKEPGTTVHGVTKSQILFKGLIMHTCTTPLLAYLPGL